MIISRTPLRISFFGGGTDYPIWFRENGGAVLATTIDKYVYLTCRYLPPFFEHKHRIAYSIIELVQDIDEIKHPSVREILRLIGMKEGVEIHYDGDLPARTGMGSSSAFIVGLLNSLYCMIGKTMSKSELARVAIDIEQRILNQNVGCQDQILASYGGFRKIIFKCDDRHEVVPITIGKERLKLFGSHLMLLFTGFSRIASEIALEQIRQTPQKKHELTEMGKMVDIAIDILNNSSDLSEFGKLLNESWELKKSLTDKISTPYIDYLYEKALGAGACGGKLLGAGGGGFLLLLVEPDKHENVMKSLGNILKVPFGFDSFGSQIIFESA